SPSMGRGILTVRGTCHGLDDMALESINKHRGHARRRPCRHSVTVLQRAALRARNSLHRLENSDPLAAATKSRRDTEPGVWVWPVRRVRQAGPSRYDTSLQRPGTSLDGQQARRAY